MSREYVQEIWEVLHEIPEPAFEEHKTSSVLAEELEKMGLELETNVNGTTGIIATLKSGKPGKIIGIRADIDALTYEVDGKTEYRHACGHDAHMSMVLTVAKILSEKGIESGELRFIFQPAEETLNGAMKMIESGLLNDLDEIYGLHIRPVQDCKFGEAIAAIRHSAAAPTHVKVKGVNAHAARPHLGVNAAEACANIVNAVNSIKGNPNISHSAKVTKIMTADSGGNVIPDEAYMYFDVRCAENDEMERIIEKLEAAIKNGAAANGAEVDYTIEFCPGAELADDSVATIAESITEVLGEENLIMESYNPGSEDFHNYAREIGCKAGYFGVGADASPGLHDVNMSFNREAMYHGVDIMLKVIEKRMNA